MVARPRGGSATRVRQVRSQRTCPVFPGHVVSYWHPFSVWCSPRAAPRRPPMARTHPGRTMPIGPTIPIDLTTPTAPTILIVRTTPTVQMIRTGPMTPIDPAGLLPAGRAMHMRHQGASPLTALPPMGAAIPTRTSAATAARAQVMEHPMSLPRAVRRMVRVRAVRAMVRVRGPGYGPGPGGPGGYAGPPYGPGPRPYDERHESRTYSRNEIVDTGHRFFGSLSQGLASVVEYAFKTAGRPNGYILGEDLGGAFIAGLRYGEGTLHTKDAGLHKVFWQGPSFGYDLGAEGARTMVLIYNLRDPSEIYNRFGGVEGSAYFVGGVGIQFQKHGDVIVAPIRAGVGLRLGANIGYLKYTRTPTWNPF